MWIIRISLDLFGEEFSPKKLLKEITQPVHIFYAHEPDDTTGSDSGETFENGNLSLLAPQIYGFQDKIEQYQNWYFNFIEKFRDAFERHRVTEINLFIEVFDSGGQVNFEIFSRELLKKAAKYNIAIPISFYRLTLGQITDMLSEAGFPQEFTRRMQQND